MSQKVFSVETQRTSLYPTYNNRIMQRLDFKDLPMVLAGVMHKTEPG